MSKHTEIPAQHQDAMPADEHRMDPAPIGDHAIPAAVV